MCAKKCRLCEILFKYNFEQKLKIQTFLYQVAICVYVISCVCTKQLVGVLNNIISIISGNDHMNTKFLP